MEKIKTAKKMHCGKILAVIYALFFVYILISCTVPPAFHKAVDKEAAESYQSEGSEGERVLCVDDNADALVWRLRIIESAKRELILSTFDLADDESGRMVMSALYEAAERGVSVRILADGLNGEFKLIGNDCFETLAAHENVEAKLYNKANLLTPWTVNYRMHDKYLIADSEIYILGGRNTRDLFLGECGDVYNIDRDILVYKTENAKNPSVTALRNYFERVWGEPCNFEIEGSLGEDRLESGRAALDESYALAREKYPQGFFEPDWIGLTVKAASVRLLWGKTACENKAPFVFDAICEMMKEHENILIETPYIVCDDAMYAELSALCEEGKSVTVLTNAVESGANPWGCTDYLNQKENILATGCTVCEYMGEQSLHTKTVLLDGNISIVGSYNLDMRSTYLDTELMLVIDCEELNSELRKKAEERMEMSKSVNPDGSYTLGPAYEERAIGFPKNIFYWILRVVMIPLRHLL